MSNGSCNVGTGPIWMLKKYGVMMRYQDLLDDKGMQSHIRFSTVKCFVILSHTTGQCRKCPEQFLCYSPTGFIRISYDISVLTKIVTLKLFF